VVRGSGGQVVRGGDAHNKTYICRKNRMRFIKIILLFLFLAQILQGQDVPKDTIPASSIPFIYGFYGYQWPGGEMKNQFGSNSVIGPGFMWKTQKNWLFGGEYNFIFGNDVKITTEIFKNLYNSDGNIISGGGTPAVVATFERGNLIAAKFGKLFPVIKSDRNSGIFFTVGTGYMMHKIRIEVENEAAPQLEGDYKRGYDRLSGGFMLNQAIGFMYFGQRKMLNFTLSVEAFESWNKPYRDYYFDAMAPAPEGRQFDFLVGPKLSWMIPLRSRNEGKYYYY
jgi:hypothetical protein